ncbi:ATP-binding protein [Alkalicoccus halolimnae]|uniref:AAA family ATPase n=1 Tax=Alkalicoccus halolimnae TaxID=1667239 RepID=A0A5C7F934_9BACI|nr:AAA family ATPase [Alkalicoccus halolimnae]TXF86543.1 AAA family ATPase [Alkalicoccus halolimnae]
MKLEHIRIDSFGKWQNCSWEMDGSLLFFGHNETGKSTIMQFIESVLFGFKTINKGAGGALTFTDARGRWHLERFQGRIKAGDVKVALNGESSDLKTFLQGIDTAAFRYMYRIDLEHLRLMQESDPEEVNRRLFDTSLTGITSLFKHQEKVQKRAQDLYKPRGRKTEINRLVKDIDGTSDQLREWNKKLDQYGIIQERIKDFEEQINSVKAREAETAEQLKEEESKELLRPLLAEWQELKEAEERTPRLPVYAEREFTSLQEKLQKIKEEEAVLRAKIQNAPEKKLTEEEQMKLQNILDDFSKLELYEKQKEEADKKIQELREDQKELQAGLPEDIILENTGFSQPVIQRLEDLKEQDRMLRIQENQELYSQQEKKQDKPEPVLTFPRKKMVLAALLLAALAAGIIGEWISVFVLAALGTLLFFSAKEPVAKAENEDRGNDPKFRLKKIRENLQLEIDQWCEDAGLPYGLDLHTYTYAVDCAASWMNVQKQYSRQNEISAEAKRWMNHLAASAAEWTNLTQSEPPRSHLKMLKEVWEDHKRNIKQREQHKHEQSLVQERLNEVSAERTQLEQEKYSWIKLTDEEEEFAFIQMIEQENLLRERKMQAQECRRKMNAVVPSESKRKKLLQELEAGPLTPLKEIEDHAAHLREEREKLIIQKSENENELRTMEQEGTFSELHQRYENEKAELKDLMKKWAVYEAEDEIIEQIRKIYEKEKQPHVLRKTEERFLRMTDYAYEKVGISVEAKKFILERKDGALFGVEELSTGTRELLYVALRLALIEEQKAMPVFVDEALVNMDYPRRINLWRELQIVSRKHQIIFFTCHEHIRKEWEQYMQLEKAELR